MQGNLNLILDQVSKDKGIDKETIVKTFEQAILTAAKKTFGQQYELEARYNAETGWVDLFLVNYVVAEVQVPGRDVTVEAAREGGLESDVGDELLFQIFYRPEDIDQAIEHDKKYAKLLGFETATLGFGRIAAQTAKQVIIQRFREAERDMIYNEFKDRKGELVSGIVRRFERGNIIVDLGKTEAILPAREQVPRESYRAGDRLVAYVVDIDRAARGPQIILSRTHKRLLEKLFEQEVPEIYEKIVRIEASAREPGARAKIAVASKDRDVDPVGACVGMKGSRVQAVVQELRGEKIDIVPWDSDPARFVCNAIAPAEVARVLIDAESHTMELIVPDEKLSLAIGKKGQNVRLASQLTGWRIDIHSESKVRDLEEQTRRQMSEIEGVGLDMAETMFKLGWRSLDEVANAKPDELSAIPGLGGVEAAKRISEGARLAMEAVKARREAEVRRLAEEAKKTEEERLLSVPEVTRETLEKLYAGEFRSVEQIHKTDDLAKLVEAVGSLHAAKVLKYRVKVYLGLATWKDTMPEEEPVDDEP
ncbi:MAG: transcription termination factor NusA, partial [Myxococcota bacterium]